MNIWSVDQQGACNNTFDLVGDFSTSKAFGTMGKVWVEIKVWSASSYTSELKRCKETLEEGLAAEVQHDPHLGGVLLLACRVEEAGSGSWAVPMLSATLLKRSSSRWQCLVAEEVRKSRGKALKPKPALATVWPKLQWVDAQGGGKVGLLSEFLKECGRPHKSPGKRATTLNKLLANAGCAGKLYVTKLKARCGKAPWVGDRSTLRALYSLL